MATPSNVGAHLRVLGAFGRRTMLLGSLVLFALFLPA